MRRTSRPSSPPAQRSSLDQFQHPMFHRLPPCVGHAANENNHPETFRVNPKETGASVQRLLSWSDMMCNVSRDQGQSIATSMLPFVGQETFCETKKILQNIPV